MCYAKFPLFLEVDMNDRKQRRQERSVVGDLLLTGAEQRPSRFLPAPEWQSTQKALALRLDADSGKMLDKFEYVTPPSACPQEAPGIGFKAATVYGNKLYACTSTEVLIYELPDFRQVGYISLPCFNDLHHVLPTPTGTLIVVVTGLDLVVEVGLDGKVLREWSVVGEDTWARFSRDIDYRKVPTTKPHRSHPNFAFMLDDSIWATRCQLKDAICLTKPGLRIDVEVSYPHDGLIFNGTIYFTTVDGHLVMVNPRTLKVERVVDLNAIDNPEGNVLGWCRGLLPLTENLVWIGFTQLRRTKLVENLSWLKGANPHSKPTRIALYDIRTKRCLREIPLGLFGMDVIFSILTAPAVAEKDLLTTCSPPQQTRESINSSP